MRLCAVAWCMLCAVLALLETHAFSEPLVATGFLPAWLKIFSILRWPLALLLTLALAYRLKKRAAFFIPFAIAAGAGALWTPIAPWLVWLPLIAWEGLLTREQNFKTVPLAGAAPYAAAASCFLIFSIRPDTEILGLTWSLTTHALAALAFSLAWDSIGAAAVWIASTLALSTIALPSLALSPPAAWSLAIVASTALTLSIRNAKRIPLTAWPIIALMGIGAVELCGNFDWGHTLRMLAALTTAAGFFLIFRPIPLPSKTGGKFALALIASTWFLIATAKSLSPTWALAGTRLPDSVTRQANRDPSFRALRTLFAWNRRDSSLYETLEKHTNLSPETPLIPSPIQTEKTPKSPDIYLFIVDSLRRDYLGIYNSKVSFTPNLDSFAREAAAFPNAFTAYSGTSLSQQALWAGSLLPHIQEIRPFTKFDRLSAFLKLGNYHRWISRDIYLETMLTEDSTDRDLDKGTIGDYRFCRTLSEIESRLSENPSDPIFVYTRPEDLHISILKREGGKTTRDAGWNGFYPPYAERVARIDACFGRFIKTLKRKGRYKDSIIVLTADHGETLGEGSRWGHAYNLSPELLRVPLLAKGLVLKSGVVFVHDIPAMLDGTFRENPGPRLVASTYGPVYGIIKNEGRILHIADAVERESRTVLIEDGTRLDPNPADDRTIINELGNLERKFGYFGR